MSLRLNVVDGGDRGQSFPLPDAGTVRIGNYGGHTDICLHDLYVAKDHCHVEIGEDANIWYGCVLRGDVTGIVVGAGSNIQDGTVIHGNSGRPPTFIGAGVGFAGVKLANFQETAIAGLDPVQGGFLINANNFAADQTQWNFAWALHAGLAYKVTPGFSVEFAYRYLNMGDAQSGAIVGFLNNPQNTVFHIDNITSHDFTLGVRWMLQPEPAAPAYPLVRKG